MNNSVIKTTYAVHTNADLLTLIRTKDYSQDPSLTTVNLGFMLVAP